MSPHRATAATTLALGLMITAAACGTEEDANRNPVQAVQPTSYVTMEPETTVTTLAPSQTTLPPEGATNPNEQIHIIVGGDSVSKIASMFGITMDQLVQYNQWTDGINHFLTPGAEVKIPPNSKVPGTGSGTPASPGGGSAAPGAREPAGEGCEYTIVANDNPSKVAGKYDMTAADLQAANPEHDFSVWFPIDGVIRIPAGATGC